MSEELETNQNATNDSAANDNATNDNDTTETASVTTDAEDTAPIRIENNEAEAEQEPVLEPEPEPESAQELEPEAGSDANPSDDVTAGTEIAKAEEADAGMATSGENPGGLGNVEATEDLDALLAYQRIKRSRESRKRRKFIIIAIVCIIALVAGVVFVVNMGNNATESEAVDTGPITGAVTSGEFQTVISANGATEPLASTVVSPEVDGIIENVQIEEGQYVNEGDVLFTIKNDELDKAVNEAKRNMDNAQRTVDNANTAVDDAYAAYQKSWNEHNTSGDWNGFDEAGLRAAIRQAESTYEEAKSALDSAKEKVEEAQATADKRTIHAPVSGSIVTMNAVNGASVGAATGGSGQQGGSSSGPLVQISDLSQMKVTVQVNELDISTVAVGQAAKATFSAISGLELDATVQRIASTSGATNTSGGSGAGGVVTYAVDLLIPKPDERLKPGMTATVRIVTQNVPDTLIVPVASLTTEGDNSYVTVVDGENQRQVQVEVKAKNTSEAAVSGNLQEGDMVVLSGGGGADALASEGLDPALA